MFASVSSHSLTLSLSLSLSVFSRKRFMWKREIVSEKERKETLSPMTFTRLGMKVLFPVWPPFLLSSSFSIFLCSNVQEVVDWERRKRKERKRRRNEERRKRKERRERKKKKWGEKKLDAFRMKMTSFPFILEWEKMRLLFLSFLSSSDDSFFGHLLERKRKKEREKKREGEKVLLFHFACKSCMFWFYRKILSWTPLTFLTHSLSSLSFLPFFLTPAQYIWRERERE